MWNSHIENSRSWTIFKSSHNIFEVKSAPSVSVNLDTQTCSCYQWQVHGFPCVHAATVIKMSYPSVYRKISSYFLTKTYRDLYTWSSTLFPKQWSMICSLQFPFQKFYLQFWNVILEGRRRKGFILMANLAKANVKFVLDVVFLHFTIV